jgi:hypothetical protein
MLARATRNALMLALLLAIASPVMAQAHCYSVWRYPRAQRCGIDRPPVAIRSEHGAAMAAAPVLSGATVGSAALAKRVEPSPGPPFDLQLPDADPATTALRALLWSDLH